MKRTPLARRTRLAPGKPTARVTRLAQVSRTRRQQQPARKAAEAALFAIRPWCWMCGAEGLELHGHEILGRAQGGDPTKPDALLDDLCNQWCEDFPIAAAWYGWKKSRKHPAMPCITSGECQPWGHQSLTCLREVVVA